MKIGILVFPAVEELDFVGPWEMFGMWGLIGTSVEKVDAGSRLVEDAHAALSELQQELIGAPATTVRALGVEAYT